MKFLTIYLNGMLLAKQAIPDDHSAMMKMGTKLGEITVCIEHREDKPRRPTAGRDGTKVALDGG
jgi:hypothetical protein